MPVISFYAISRNLNSELLMKFAQIRAAADLEHHIERLETIAVRQPNSWRVSWDVLGNRLENVFGSLWAVEPQVQGVLPWLPNKVHSDRAGDPAARPTIPPWAATWLPALYEDSLAIRPLFESQSADE